MLMACYFKYSSLCQRCDVLVFRDLIAYLEPDSAMSANYDCAA